jgi:hypothetical protein
MIKLMLKGNSIEHLNLFLDKIINSEPFCVIRPSDGEYKVLQGDNFNNIDNWHFDGKSSLKDDLFNSIMISASENNVYIGIPTPSDSQEICDYYRNTFSLKHTNTTYANIFCNYNWKTFVHVFKNLQTPFYFIGPKITNKDHGLNIQEHFEIDEFLVNNWDEKKELVTKSLMLWAENKSGIFLFSAGPIAKIWAPELFRVKNTSICLDVGSTLDYFIKGDSNRLYTKDNYFSSLVSNF